MKNQIRNEFVRNPYNYDPDKLSDDTGLRCEDETRTQQQYLEECDINYIAEKFMRTGELPQVLNMPTSGDFSGIFDFQDAMNLIKRAKDEFMSLPAKVRSRFDNDPQKLIQFLDDPTNRTEAIGLGLIAQKENDDGSNRNASPAQPPQDQAGNQRTPGPANPAPANQTAGQSTTG